VNTHILLNTSAGQLLIDTATIVRIEAQSNYCKLWFSTAAGGSKTLVTAKLLRWFEEQLHGGHFIRLHRSHLINRQFLQPNQCMEKGCLLQNGDCIQVSRRRKKEIVKALLAA
jgi:two-component system, LytTR family, response regulator